MINFNHTKSFDEQYSQSREAQLIEYLNQRGASVPKLISNNPLHRKIEMEFVGKSLDKIFIDYKGDEINQDVYAFRFLRNSIKLGVKIADLKVWHYDLALRNFTAFDDCLSKSETVYLIDFGVAVSRLFPLQKPLWLRPDSNIHHKDLVYALERDWKIFFKKNELDTPKIIDSEFSIPIQNYINYWHHNFFVQEIQNPLCIISHSIGIMVDDFVNKYSILIKNLSKVQQIELNINSKSLKNLNSNDEAKFRINELVKYLDILILDLEILTGLTPRPSLQFKNNKDHSLENFKDSIWSIENKRWWIYIKNLKVNSIIFLMTVFCFFYVDHVYSQKNILLSERGFYISLIAITLSPFTLISLFLHNNYKIFFRTFITIEICCLAYFLYELIFGN